MFKNLQKLKLQNKFCILFGVKTAKKKISRRNNLLYSNTTFSNVLIEGMECLLQVEIDANMD